MPEKHPNPIGNDEVGSSTLPCGTIQRRFGKAKSKGPADLFKPENAPARALCYRGACAAI